MPHLDANGQSLYYEVHGDGEPLVIVMGLSADILAWALQIPEWSKRYKVIAIENRDVGRSSYATEQYDIADMADDVLALVDHLEIDTFHLLGLSMGGAISQEVVLKAPQRVETLTLVVTWGGSGFTGRERTRLWVKQMDSYSHEDHVDQLLLVTMSEEFLDNEGGRKWLRELILANPNPQKPEGFLRQLDACGRHETRDRLPSIDVPTHVIGGEHDALVPVWKSQELAEKIPGAKLSVIPRAPHNVNIEHAEQLNTLVLGFLAEHAGAPA
jgi:pimeloyl-ACP methyl ester carboxylesterase